MSESGTEMVLGRIEALERENRRLKYGGIFAAAALLVVMAEGPLLQRKRPQVVEASAFVIKARDGTVRARLGQAPDGSTELAMFDADGGDRLNLRAGHEGETGLVIKDRGEPSLQLTAAAGGSGALQMFDPASSNSATFYLRNDGASGVSLNGKGHGVWLFAEADGRAGGLIREPDGRSRDLLGPYPTPSSSEPTASQPSRGAEPVTGGAVMPFIPARGTRARPA